MLVLKKYTERRLASGLRLSSAKGQLNSFHDHVTLGKVRHVRGANYAFNINNISTVVFLFRSGAATPFLLITFLT